jgi:hypothetical protein
MIKVVHITIHMEKKNTDMLIGKKREYTSEEDSRKKRSIRLEIPVYFFYFCCNVRKVTIDTTPKLIN